MGSRQGKHRHVCQNWVLSLHRKLFWEKENQTISCLCFLDFRRKLFETLANYLGHLCRNCLVSVQMNLFFWEKSFGHFFFFCDDEPKKFRLLAQKNAGLLKLHSTSPQESFEEKNWHALVFLELERTFLQIPARNLWQICRNCIVGGQMSLLHKTSVSGKANSLSCFWFRIFSVRSLVYLQKKHRKFVSCQKWIPSLHRNNLRKKNWKFSSAFFQIFGRNISKF